jgi:ferritin-like metal-binding protein YciE
MDTLHKLLVDELKDLWSAESQLTKALPRMAQAAESET